MEVKYTDPAGQVWHMFSIMYRVGGSAFTTEIMARDFREAGEHLRGLKESGEVIGMVVAEVEA